MRPPSERVPELDGMRGVAISLVIALHAFIRPHLWFWELSLGEPLAALFDSAFCGVDIFFVLSGYLIGGVILERRGSTAFYPAFYARRTARIMPLYFVLVALAFMPFGSQEPQAAEGTVPLLGYLTFTANLFTSRGASYAFWLGPLWSICIEEQFYLLAPVGLRALRAALIPWLLIALALASASLRTALLTQTLALDFNPWDLTLTRLDGLALGVLTAWWLQARRGSTSRYQRQLLRAALALLIAGCVVFSQLPAPLLLGPGLFWFSMTASVALVLCVQQEAWLCWCMRWPVLVFLGRHSYFLYLFHMPGLWLGQQLVSEAEPTLLEVLAIDAAAMSLLCVIAVLSWRAFEAPLLALGRSVRYGHEA